MRLKIFDAHCDVLWRIWSKAVANKEPIQKPFYNDADWLQVTRRKLEDGGVGIQACAIYVPEEMVVSRAFETALEMVELFYNEVVSEDTIVIRDLQDLKDWQQGDKLGLLLTLEGADAVEGDMVKLHILHRLGVRWVGLTHNPANQVADGVGEERGAGLSNFGKEFVKELNRLRIGIDVSHLAERGFWDVVELSSQPIFASHSNAKAVYNHRRNLSDEQIKALIQNDGMIGITYVPYFTSGQEIVQIEDLIKHIDHICSLGGEKHLGLGSDFDGISRTIAGLEHSGKTYQLINELLKRYREDQVAGFCGNNWFDYLVRLWS
jgi:membrane dipeptidase